MNTYTYTLSHPQLSHPLEMDSTIERTDRALIAWATMYILRNHDVMVEREGWTVEVTHDETATCQHCGRSIILEGDVWIDPEATGDDSVWRETCDAHDTFQAEHEPEVTS